MGRNSHRLKRKRQENKAKKSAFNMLVNELYLKTAGHLLFKFRNFQMLKSPVFKFSNFQMLSKWFC